MGRCGGRDVAEETGAWQGGRQASPAAKGPLHTAALAAESSGSSVLQLNK